MQKIVLIATAVISFSACGNDDPRSKQSTPRSAEQSQPIMKPASVPTFSGKHAFSYLIEQTVFGPRNPNSAGHMKCLRYLTTTLRELADEVRLQEFTHTGYGGEKLHLTNIIASFNPRNQTRVLLCAHWDTRPRADQEEEKGLRSQPILGANDGASGVAALLEIASLMKRTPPPIGVDIVLFDGEDYGTEGDHANYLLGSKHFAKNTPANYTPRFGILVDMVGDKFLEIAREQHSVKYAPDIVDLVWRTARRLGYAQFIEQLGDMVTDDHLPLNEAGIKTINIIDFNYPDISNRYWHTHQDTPGQCSPESLEAVGTVITHVIYAQVP